MPFVYDVLQVKPTYNGTLDLRLLLRRNPEIGLMYLYVESHTSALKGTGFRNCFQNRVHVLTPNGLLLRPDWTYNETKHGNILNQKNEATAHKAEVALFAETTNKLRMRDNLRERIEMAVQFSQSKIEKVDAFLLENATVSLKK